MCRYYSLLYRRVLTVTLDSTSSTNLRPGWTAKTQISCPRELGRQGHPTNSKQQSQTVDYQSSGNLSSGAILLRIGRRLSGGKPRQRHYHLCTPRDVVRSRQRQPTNLGRRPTTRHTPIRLAIVYTRSSSTDLSRSSGSTITTTRTRSISIEIQPSDR